MTEFTVIYIRSCDNCGNDIQDEGEMLCRKCKPSLQKKSDLRKAWDEIDAAYWRFCRCARAAPPSMAAKNAWEFLLDNGIVYNKDLRP